MDENVLVFFVEVVLFFFMFDGIVGIFGSEVLDLFFFLNVRVLG